MFNACIHILSSHLFDDYNLISFTIPPLLTILEFIIYIQCCSFHKHLDAHQLKPETEIFLNTKTNYKSNWRAEAEKNLPHLSASAISTSFNEKKGPNNVTSSICAIWERRKKIEHAYMHDRIRAKKKMSIQDS